LLPSLTGVKGRSGCAVQQNSKSDLVQGPAVLELEEEPIASLALGLLQRRRSNRQADDDSSDGDPDFSSDNGDSSEAEQGRSSTSKHSQLSKVDEQRLLAYKKEDKPWDWIFGKFPGRTRLAVRTRWNMIRPKVVWTRLLELVGCQCEYGERGEDAMKVAGPGTLEHSHLARTLTALALGAALSRFN